MIATYNMLNDLNSLLDAFVEPHFTSRNEIPHVQYREDEDTINVRYLVPGAVSDDIDLQLENNVLRVSYEKKALEGEHKYLRRERHIGTFSKAIKLPYKVDAESIKAELKEGVLSVSLKKSEDAKPRKIEIS